MAPDSFKYRLLRIGHKPRGAPHHVSIDTRLRTNYCVFLIIMRNVTIIRAADGSVGLQCLRQNKATQRRGTGGRHYLSSEWS
jgi:hypothetical protein